MDIRILTWTASMITGLLVTSAGVHFFRCGTNTSVAKYGEDSYFLYFCPVKSNSFDITLAVPVTSQQQNPPAWGQPNDNATMQLGQHKIFRDRITLSGFSSGGTFAQQFQISYSSLVSGIATFSHAYYRCGPGNGREADYDDACTIVGENSLNGTYNPARAMNDIREYERQGLIEDTRNLRNKRLYVYAGTRSTFFDLDLSLAVLRIYEPLIQNIRAIKTRVQDAEQLLPTLNFGNPCTESAADTWFLGNCGLSGAEEALQFLLGPAIKTPPNGFRANQGSLMAFDQTEFFYGFEGEHFMDSIGYIYVPRHCLQKTCFLHFYFHGCLTGRNFNGTGTNHLANSGYLELAEANDLIIVAPQAVGNQENQIECWDTYGLTGPLYATQRGAQITVVRNILARILGEENASQASRPRPVVVRQQQWQSQKPVKFPSAGGSNNEPSSLEVMKAVNRFFGEYKVNVEY